MNMELAIFDLDGTLIDSMTVWRNIGREYLKNEFNIQSTKSLEEKLNTLSFTKSIEYLVKEYNMPKSVDEVLNDLSGKVFKAYSETIDEKEGALNYLKYLKEKNVKMCIATACEKTLAEIVTKRLGISDYVDFIITVDEIKKPKTEPDIFLYCSEKYGISIDKCVVFEDSLFAIKSAKSVGFFVVAMKDLNYEDDKEIIDINSDMQIDNYYELMK